MTQESERARDLLRPKQSSHREFGLVMAAAFLVVTFFSYWKHRHFGSYILPGLSFAFFFFALVLPRALAPLNAAWTILGRILHRVVSPLVLGVMYFGFFTPLGLLFRLVKKDPLHLKIDRQSTSYWIHREKTDQPSQGMSNQF